MKNNTNPKKTKRSAVFFSTIVVALAMMMGFGGCANLNDPSDWDNWEMEQQSNIEQVEDKKEENSNVENDVVFPSNGGFNVIKTSTNGTSEKDDRDARIAELEDKVASLTSELENATSTISGLTSENKFLSDRNAEKEKFIIEQNDALKEARNPFAFDENGNLTCDFEYAEKAARRQNYDGTWYYLVQAGKKLITTDVRSCADYRPEYLDNHFDAARNGYQIIGKAGNQYGVYSIASGGVAYVGKANVNGYALVDTTKQNGRGGDFAAIFHNSFVYVEDESAEYGYSVYLAGDYVAPKPSNDTKKDDNKKDNTIVIEKVVEVEKTVEVPVEKIVEVEKVVEVPVERVIEVERVVEVEVPGETKVIYVPVPTTDDETPENNPKPDDDADFDTPENNPQRDDDADFDQKSEGDVDNSPADMGDKKEEGPSDMGNTKDDGPADMGNNQGDGPDDMNPENNPVDDDDFGSDNDNNNNDNVESSPSDMNSAVSNNGDDDFGGANDGSPSDMDTIVSSVVEIESNDAPENSYASGDDQF